ETQEQREGRPPGRPFFICSHLSGADHGREGQDRRCADRRHDHRRPATRFTNDLATKIANFVDSNRPPGTGSPLRPRSEEEVREPKGEWHRALLVFWRSL